VQQGAPRWITKVSGRGPGAKRARCEASGEPGQVDRWMVRRGEGKGEREGKGRGAGSVSRVGAAVRAGKGGGGRRAGDPTQPWRGKRGLAETLSLPLSWKFAWSTCFGGRLEGFLG